MDPAGLARGQATRAVAARAPGTVPRARHAKIGLSETGVAVTHLQGRLTPMEYELRASQIRPVA
jgi:hypothetical protein